MEKIRKATLKDIEDLKKVKPTLTDEHICERLKRQGEKLLEYLVLETNGEVVSFVLLKWHGKETHPEYPDIEDLFTREDQRAKGYGSALIKECEKLAKEKGFKKIGLAANPDINENARGLYEKLGFRHDGKESYVDGIYNGVEDWVVDLEKEI
jgi:GNAT superfamily N-acetyltransferase